MSKMIGGHHELICGATGDVMGSELGLQIRLS